MGISESRTHKLPLQYYSEVETQTGKCSIYKLGELYLQKLSIIIQSSSKLNSIMDVLRIFTKQEKHLQKIYSLEFENAITCVQQKRINVFCDYYSFTLKDAISKKIGKSRIQEDEIWYIFKSIVEAGYFLQKRKLIIGDIRPQTIYVSHDHQIKIPVINIKDNFENSNYLQSFLCFKQGCLLSPQQFQQLKQAKKSSINYYKSDVYALGMTLVECCSKLDSSLRFYKYSQFSINQQKLKLAIHELKGFYSASLVEMISEMLNPDQTNRPDFRYLCGWLDSRCGNLEKNNLSLSCRSSTTTLDSFQSRKQKPHSKFSLRK